MSNFGFFFSPTGVRKSTSVLFRNVQGTKYVSIRYANRVQAKQFLSYGVIVRSISEVTYAIGATVRGASAIGYSVSAGIYKVVADTLVGFSNRVQSSSFVGYGLAASVRGVTALGYLAAKPVRGAVEASYALVTPVRNYVNLLYSTYLTFPVRAFNTLRYSVSPYSLVLAIDGVPSVTIGSVTSTILSGSVFIDEGEGVWRGNLVVAGMETYLAATLGAPVQVVLGADTYLMFVDSRSLSMSGPAQIDTEVSLVSSGAFLSSPRAIPENVTIDTPVLVSQLADTLADTVGVDWLLSDWTLRAGIKEWRGSMPLDILKELADVAGGVIDALPSGRLVARPKYPVSPQQYLSVIPDVQIHTEVSALAVTEEHTTLARYGTFRIMDTPEELQDRLDYVADEIDSLRGEVFAYPQPYRTSIELVSTSDSAIVIGAGQWLYREEEEEIEILGGEGSTQYPIVSILSAVWNDLPAGTIQTEFYKTSVVLQDSIGYGLLKIKYRTLALVYTVSSAAKDTSQFLLQEI